MKQLTCIVFILFTACNQDSSPDGRSKMRDAKLQEEIENLKSQNKALQDSLILMNERINSLKAN